ncbi:ATP-binding protein [Bifidobacterium olomucense]|uniref:ATPase n=1 Tax=Bifidobacterium olomucense TaxID=2675324 RepID=A0A7Y0HX95_9BIFI|nr:ATP-binding protein [Bifidobacterium sp. DSM 109959]NMM99136.1 ATPase [Bifidobacterium sp. DSM 109959]
MFVKREHEPSTLNRLWERDGFQTLVLHGRRSIGKTALLDEFSCDKRTLYFTAQQQTPAANFRDFSRTIYRFFSTPDIIAFFSFAAGYP